MNEQQFYYPNRWGRLVLTSAEEIVGEKGMAALLNMAKIPEYIGNYPPDNMEKGFSPFPGNHVKTNWPGFDSI